LVQMQNLWIFVYFFVVFSHKFLCTRLPVQRKKRNWKINLKDA
jgi:hypothetical protein